MSGVSLSVTRPTGRALVVASTTSRAALVNVVMRQGFECAECDDPYTAMLELSRRRLAYGTLVLSLASLYREELSLIPTVRRRLPHLEIWLAHTDGRQAALAEAMRLGADGLMDDEGLHRMAVPPPTLTQSYQAMPASAPNPPPADSAPTEEQAEPVEQAVSAQGAIGEPVLTADELRALLQDQPVMPPSGPAEET